MQRRHCVMQRWRYVIINATLCPATGYIIRHAKGTLYCTKAAVCHVKATLGHAEETLCPVEATL